MDWKVDVTADGEPRARVSNDGRYRIEKHPFASKYMLTDRGSMVGIFTTLIAAQRAVA